MSTREPSGHRWSPSTVRRWTAAAVLTLTMCTACSADEGAGGPAGEESAGPGWRPVAASPLGARVDAAAVPVGGEVLVVGGHRRPCAPNASCSPPPLLDGAAAYDVAADRWRRIAEPPVKVRWWSTAVVGGEVLAVASTDQGVTLLAYSVAADRWTRPPAPPDVGGVRLVAAGDRVVAYRSRSGRRPPPDRLRDPRSGAWSELPADPLGSLIERTMVQVAPDRLVLTGVPTDDASGDRGAPLYRAALLDLSTLTWRRFPTSEVLFSQSTWRAVGTGDGVRVVNPTGGSWDGDGRFDRTYRASGVLDPFRGVWSPLAEPPELRHDLDPRIPAVAGGGLLVDDGHVLDVGTGAWRPLEPPRALRAVEQGVAVWAGDRLFVWGGLRRSSDGSDGSEGAELLSTGWTWRP